MSEMFGDIGLWFKSIHIMSVLAWMAGLFYLPRLFVYHAGAADGGEASENFKVMERRLLKIIMTPSMAFSWVFGLAAAWEFGVYAEFWFYLKISIVAIMTAFHFKLAKYQREFEVGQNKKTKGFYRAINEIPTILMIFIVVLAVFKPNPF